MNTSQTSGVTPSQILAKNPAPWQSVTYHDGSIRVFNALGGEVGLLELLSFSIGLANASGTAKTAAGNPA